MLVVTGRDRTPRRVHHPSATPERWWPGSNGTGSLAQRWAWTATARPPLLRRQRPPWSSSSNVPLLATPPAWPSLNRTGQGAREKRRLAPRRRLHANLISSASPARAALLVALTFFIGPIFSAVAVVAAIDETVLGYRHPPPPSPSNRGQLVSRCAGTLCICSQTRASTCAVDPPVEDAGGSPASPAARILRQEKKENNTFPTVLGW